MAKEIVIMGEVPVRDLKFGFGNPRKIDRKKKDELRESLSEHGDFGIILIDENYNVIAGNQRARILIEDDPDATVCCKMLKGYSVAELRVINIKDNTHSGEYDLDKLAEWTADLNLDLGLDLDNKDIS